MKKNKKIKAWALIDKNGKLAINCGEFWISPKKKSLIINCGCNEKEGEKIKPITILI